jgi:hypothetical protein
MSSRCSKLAVLGALAAFAAGATACTDDPPPTEPGPVLTRTADEPAGANCAEGGTAVLAGTDRDDDGQLDDTEVETTVYVCRRDRVRLVVEAPGTHCAAGGTAVWVGDDRDGDDVLEEEEVRDVAYVCADVHDLVSRLDVDAFDAPCEEGAALRIGLDRDDDAVLDDDEIMITEYVCGAALEGNIIIRSAADVARYAHVRAVVGDLNAWNATNTEIVLPNLWHVGGSVQVYDASALTALRLPQLYRVGESFSLARDPRLATVEVPNLRYVTGSVTVIEVGLTALELDYVQITDALLLRRNPTLAALDWVSADLWGRVEIEGNPLLATIALEGRGPPTAIWVRDNAVLTSAKFDTSTVRGDVWVDDNAALSTLWLEVGKVEGDLVITDNPVLDRLRGDVLWSGGLQVVEGNLHIATSPISRWDLCCDGLVVGGNATLANLRVPRLRDDSNQLEWVMGDLHVSDNPGLTDLRLKAAGGIAIVNNPVLTHASFFFNDDDDQTASEVTVMHNPALEWLTTAYLTHVDGNISIHDNPALDVIGLDDVRLAEYVSVTDNDALPACYVTYWFSRLQAWGESQSGNDTAATCQ